MMPHKSSQSQWELNTIAQYVDYKQGLNLHLGREWRLFPQSVSQAFPWYMTQFVTVIAKYSFGSQVIGSNNFEPSD